MVNIGADREFFVTTSRGLEPSLAEELQGIGGRDVEVKQGGVSLRGPTSLVVDLNLWVSTGLRVLLPILEGQCQTSDDLYDFVSTVDWSQYLEADGSLAVHCVGRGGPGLKHTRYAALRVKDAIVDQFRDRCGRRPDVDRLRPDLRIHVHLRDSRVLLSLDSSCESLHRRGYRLQSGEAALRETLAAGIVRSTGWDGQSSFVDLMCGSGTLCIEAARLALGKPAGADREDFGYWRWKAFQEHCQPQHHQAELEHILGNLRPTPDSPFILGFDQDPEMVEVARQNAARAGVSEWVRFETRALAETSELPTPGDTGVVICNPPYGERLGNKDELQDLYRLIGDTYKRHAKGYKGFVLAGNLNLAKSIGLRSSRRLPLWNGPIECRLLSYELYAGSRRKRVKQGVSS